MNSIVRVIIRGLISGEIKPEPRVFEYLRELSERELKRHSRILRCVEPSAQEVPAPDGPTPGGDPVDDGCGASDGTSCEAPPSNRHRMTFTKLSCGRWIRVVGCWAVLCLVWVAGSADAHAAVMGRMDPHAAWLATPFAGGLSQVMVGTLARVPQGTLIASGSLLAGLLVGAGWKWFCRNKLFVMKPYEIALQELETAEHRIRGGEEQDYDGQVLNILQRYVQAQLKLFKPRGMTGDAFLHALTERTAPLTGYQKLLLCDVIDQVAKHASMASEQIDALSQKASHFVWATASYRPAGSGDFPELMGTTGVS